MQPDYVFTNPPLITRAMQAEMLKHLALNWPATPTGFTAEMVRDALNAGAEALTCAPSPKRSQHQVLREDFGLDLKRFAADDEIRQVGVRVSHNNEKEVRKIWGVNVNRLDREADVYCNGQVVLNLRGSEVVGAVRLEKIAVSAIYRIICEKMRCAMKAK